ncbi:hypothetical protein GCM10027047_19570 [Rhodococcus aerolatus]
MTRAVGALVLGALVAWLLHRRLARATRAPRWLSRLLALVLAALTAAAVVGLLSGSALDPSWARPVAFVGLTWLAVVLYLLLGLAVLGVVLGVVRLARRGRRTGGTDESRRTALRVATVGVVATALGVTGWALRRAADPLVTRVRVPLAGLPPELAGLRIAVVSDLHVGPARGAGFTRRVVELVNAQSPDVVALTGDLVDGTVALVGDALVPVRDLRAPLGVFGVTGNHEYYAGDVVDWVRFWPTVGITPLTNTRVELRRGAGVLDLAGVNDVTGTDPYPADLDAALAGRDPSRVCVLLAHEPRQVGRAAQLGVDLQLSGHTHGGQLWPLDLLVPLQQPAVEGLARFGPTTLYTTRGVGTWGPPVRVGADPEVTVVELVPAP